MPSCEMFGDWVAVEGSMLEEDGNRGHVLLKNKSGLSNRVRSFPTYEEARAWAEKQYKEFTYSPPSKEGT